MSAVATPAWQTLAALAADEGALSLRERFAADPDRFQRFSRRLDGLLLDFSKQRIGPEIFAALLELAAAADLEGWREKLAAGEAINVSEGRAVRHMDLRAGATAPAAVRAVLSRLEDFCAAIHGGTWRGHSGERVTDVVNLGIGGSDLGPRMAVRALASFQQPDLRVHFVANVDGADLATVLAKLNPRTTLFVVASKTFTTLETMTNAASAREWLIAAAGSSAAVGRHFVAVSSNLGATGAFGIAPENVFEFWDWVGGRFSLWSAIGLPIALAVGFHRFAEMLAGAHDLDRHFLEAPPVDNLPLILALLDVWNTSFLGAGSRAVLPYSQSLHLLPGHLQQLEMESNGKTTGRDGAPTGTPTCPVVWGEAGTNGQHSFYQLLHQGGRLIPCDFIALKEADFPLPGHHEVLLANCLAQSAALAFGQTADEARAAGASATLVPHKVFPGNQPSTTLLLPRLDPRQLGRLIALYEHKVFCLGVLWGLNSFDQWGVELGKTLAARLAPALEGGDSSAFDASTRGLLAALRR